MSAANDPMDPQSGVPPAGNDSNPAVEGFTAPNGTQEHETQQQQLSEVEEPQLNPTPDAPPAPVAPNFFEAIRANCICAICRELVVAPHSFTPCGHNHCAGCLVALIPHSRGCPTCRSQATAAPTHQRHIDPIIASIEEHLTEEEKTIRTTKLEAWDENRELWEEELKSFVTARRLSPSLYGSPVLVLAADSPPLGSPRYEPTSPSHEPTSPQYTPRHSPTPAPPYRPIRAAVQPPPPPPPPAVPPQPQSQPPHHHYQPQQPVYGYNTASWPTYSQYSQNPFNYAVDRFNGPYSSGAVQPYRQLQPYPYHATSASLWAAPMTQEEPLQRPFSPPRYHHHQTSSFREPYRYQRRSPSAERRPRSGLGDSPASHRRRGRSPNNDHDGERYNHRSHRDDYAYNPPAPRRRSRSRSPRRDQNRGRSPERSPSPWPFPPPAPRADDSRYNVVPPPYMYMPQHTPLSYSPASLNPYSIQYRPY